MAIINVDTTVYKLVQTPAENVFTLTGGALNTIKAANVSIVDAGDYYVSDNVEGALQEAGAALSDITEPQSGQGITVGIDGSVNLGGGTDITGTKTIALESGATLRFSTDAGLVVEISDTVFSAEIGGKRIELDQDAGFLVTNTPVNAKNYLSEIQTLTISAGLIAWNIANGQRAKVTLTSSVTLSNPTNTGNASFPDLEVLQDGTGGRVLSFGSNFVTPVGYVAAPTTANSYTLYHFQLRSDGKLSVAYTHYAS